MNNTFRISRNLLYLNIAISLFYFSLTYIGSYTNITLLDLFIIITLIFVVALTQYFLLKNHIMFLNERITFTIFIFFNIYAVNLVFNEAFIKQPF